MNIQNTPILQLDAAAPAARAWMVEVMFAIARFRPHLSEEHQRVLQELRSENANLRLPGCIELSFHGRTRHEPSTALIHVCVFGGGE